MPILARLGDPRARPAFRAANLDRTGPSEGVRNPPIETIAAEVDQTTAACKIALDGIEHRRGKVFGMSAGDDHTVASEQIDTFAI